MDFNIAMIIASTIYVFLIILFFFSRERVSNQETKIYSYLLLADVISIVLEFLCVLSAKIDPLGTSLLAGFAGRAFLVAINLWLSIFTLYIMIVTLSKTSKDEKKHDKYYKIVATLFVINSILK